MNSKPKKLVIAIALASNIPLAMAGQPKVDICHFDSSGNKHLINVALKAANKHLGNHADTLPEDRYLDADGDGFGNPEVFIETCDEIDGFVATGDDLDDTDPTIGNVEPTAAPPTYPTAAPPPVYGPPAEPPATSAPPAYPPASPPSYG